MELHAAKRGLTDIPLVHRLAAVIHVVCTTRIDFLEKRYVACTKRKEILDHKLTYYIRNGAQLWTILCQQL